MSTSGGRRPRRRVRPSAIAAVLLLVAPIIEIMALIAVSKVIGGWWTFLLLVATSILGAWLIRHEGSRAWRSLVEALGTGRMPARELADGVLVLVGGTLLLAPGFVTDAAGLLLVLPFTRPLMRRLLEAVITRRMLVQGPPAGMFFPGAAGYGPGGAGAAGSGGRSRASREVIEGEVIEGEVIEGDVVEGDVVDDEPPVPPNR